MKTFAFIFFPQTIKQLECFLPWRKIIPGFFLKSYLKNILPFKISHIKKIRSIQDKEIQGYFIVCPLISQSEGRLDEDAVLRRLSSAVDIAKCLGTHILGLDTSFPGIGKDKNVLEKKLKIPLTSGYTLTAWSIFAAIYRIAKIKNIDLKSSTLVIIGEVASIGALCADKLCAYIPRIIQEVMHKDKPEFQKAINEAGIVINLNSSPDSMLNIIKELKSGAIVCDICLGKDAIAKLKLLRRDITIIRAGLIRLPFPIQLGIKLGLPKEIVSAPIAETMLMAFEDKVPGYSLSGGINPDKLEELADIAVRHGFEVWVPEAPVL